MVVRETFKYVVTRLKCHHSGCALMTTCQPRDNIFECSLSNRASSVYCVYHLWQTKMDYGFPRTFLRFFLTTLRFTDFSRFSRWLVNLFRRLHA